MRLNSVMNHNFSRVEGPQIQRSVFRRPTTHKTTFDPGVLIPFLVDEVLPGDTFTVKTTMFARVQTLIRPIMDNLFLDTQYFFVPSRILWENWERFMGAQDTPTSSIDYLVPVLDMETDSEFNAATIYDYLGLPVQAPFNLANAPIALVGRAYNKIWNEWYRDENLQAKVPENIGDGPDDPADYVLLHRGKRLDYVTSCLPWPQKGDNVPIPMSGLAPVIGDGSAMGFTTGAADFYLAKNSTSGTNALLQGRTAGGVLPLGLQGSAPNTSEMVGLNTDPDKTHVYANLSLTEAGWTVADLRNVITLQQFLERDARGGTRYVEILNSRFGVDVPDYRLQRPEYLGGSSQPIDVRAVPQTSQTSGTAYQGTLTATSEVISNNGFHKSFVEHGYVIGLVSVRADIVYQQAMRKMWTRRTRYDYYDPIFAHLGEQAVLQSEVNYTDYATASDVFGYQERWAEYRYFPSMVTGAFRSNYPGGSLDTWHLAPNPATQPPELTATWIQDDPPVGRIVAVQNQDKILFDSYAELICARPIPTYSTPGLRRF